MFFIKQFTFSLTILSITVFLPSSLAIPCADDPGYQFGRTSNGVLRTCAWLSRSGDIFLCNRRFHSHVTIGQKCPDTCGLCAAVTPGCTDFTNWSDELGDTCRFYGEGDNCFIWGFGYPDNFGNTAQNACCECGGGCVTSPENWVDSQGNGCDWYAQDPARSCRRFGGSRRNDGFVANQACCVCGGGVNQQPIF